MGDDCPISVISKDSDSIWTSSDSVGVDTRHNLTLLAFNDFTFSTHSFLLSHWHAFRRRGTLGLSDGDEDVEGR